MKHKKRRRPSPKKARPSPPAPAMAGTVHVTEIGAVTAIMYRRRNGASEFHHRFSSSPRLYVTAGGELIIKGKFQVHRASGELKG